MTRTLNCSGTFAGSVKASGESITLSVDNASETEEKPDPEPSSVDDPLPDVASMTAREVLAAVDRGQFLPEMALESEKTGKNRTSLINVLKQIVERVQKSKNGS